jgi:hypothetical protein
MARRLDKLILLSSVMNHDLLGPLGYILHGFGKKAGELSSSSSRVMDTEDSRRAGFVDKLLDMDANTTPHQVEDASDGATSVDSRSIEDSYSVHEKKETYLVNRTGSRSAEQVDNQQTHAKRHTSPPSCSSSSLLLPPSIHLSHHLPRKNPTNTSSPSSPSSLPRQKSFAFPSLPSPPSPCGFWEGWFLEV